MTETAAVTPEPGPSHLTHHLQLTTVFFAFTTSHALSASLTGMF
jgi:hypothetical protein